MRSLLDGSELKLEALKRPELQKLAKKYGIKANLRNAKLIEEITLKLSESKESKSPSISLSPKLTITSAKVKDKKSFSPNICNFSSDVVTLDSISPPPLAELSPDKSDIAETSLSVRSRNSKTSSRSSSRTRAKVVANESPESPIVSDEKTNNITRRTNSRNMSDSVTSRSRSSSRNRTEKQTPGSSKQKKTPISSKTKTPSNKTNLRKTVNTQTFSVPKKRTQTRLSSSATKRPALAKQATKRKSSLAEQPPQAKRGRVNGRRGKEKKQEAVPAKIQNVENTSKLLGFGFAVKGLTVPKPSFTPSTKMFEKAHQKNFEKMESIDDYQKRKEERIEKLFGSSKKQSQINRLAKPKTPSIVKPVTRPKPNLISPKSKPARPTKKSNYKPAVFKPTVTKIGEINTNFGSKRSKLVTPKKVTVSFAKSPEKKLSNLHTPGPGQRSMLPKRKSGTPFRQNTSIINTPQSQKKNAFNLQESLKKPLSWKPHKGPLKKFEDTAKKPNLKEKAKSLKQPKLTSREARRAQAKEARTASRSDRMMQKRGLK